jgi:signal peptidase II
MWCVVKTPGSRLFAAAAGAVIVADLATKILVWQTMAVCAAPPVALCDQVRILGPLGLLRTENPGTAFGVLGNVPIPVAVLAALLFIGAQLIAQPSSRLLGTAVGLEVGGLLANLVDRIVNGAVTDYIDIRGANVERGVVFNPADIALAVGAALFFLIVLARLARPQTARSA